MNQNTKRIWKYILDNKDKNITSMDIARDLELKEKTVTCTITRSFVYHNLVERIPAIIYLEDGSPKNVKFIKLTEYGETVTEKGLEEISNGKVKEQTE